MKPALALHRRILLLILAVALCTSSNGRAQSNAVFVADFSNPGMVPSHWTLTLHPDGSGHFRSEDERSSAGEQSPAATPGERQPGERQQIDSPGQDSDIQLSKDYADHVFQVASQHHWFNENCESKLKVAFQGWKKLSYDGPGGHGSCTFNFSKDKEIQELGDSLVAVAETLHEGARLEMLLQHDRLGLDKEMEYLTDGAKEGRLQQISAIRGILQRLAEDDEVLERVRKRAQLLLAHSGSQPVN